MKEKIIPLRVAGALIFILFLWRWAYLLHFLEWGDESETIVAAQLIVEGESLYGDFFNHHGPLTFLPGVLVALLGGSEIWHYRIPILCIQVIALIALYFSPIWKREAQRLLGVTIAAVAFTVVLPFQFGHMYKYQVLAGLILFSLLFTTLIPLSLGLQVAKWNLYAYGAFAASLPFLSISYLPIFFGLIAAVLRTATWKKVTSGIGVGVALNLVFLWIIGSLNGYLAYHFYLNFSVLSKYSNTTIQSLLSNALVLPTSSVAWFLTILLIVYALNKVAGNSAWGHVRLIIFGIALASLLIRGDNFHALPFFYATLGLVISSLNFVPEFSKTLSVISFLAVGLLGVRLAPFYGPEVSFLSSNQPPKSTTFSTLVNQLTEDNERILAWSFQNYQYIASKRLPAIGNYFLLPWQMAYEKSPVLGVNLDTCASFERTLPKVVMADKWKVWDSFEWNSYAECINKSLDKHYWQLPGTSIFILQDIVSNDLTTLQDVEMSRVAGEPIAAAEPQVLKIVQPLQNPQNKEIKSMAILLGTQSEKSRGKIAVMLNSQNGKHEFFIDLENLVDNEFFVFPIEPGKWESVTIRSTSGDSTLSVWSAVGNLGTLPCLRLGFTDGTFSFTPGCW